MKQYLFIVLLCTFLRLNAAQTGTTPRAVNITTSTSGTTATKSINKLSSCTDISIFRCGGAVKLYSDLMAFCADNGPYCCKTCQGIELDGIRPKSRNVTRIRTTTTPTQSTVQVSSCTDRSSFKCEEAYKSSNDKLSFCAENGIYCCETCTRIELDGIRPKSSNITRIRTTMTSTQSTVQVSSCTDRSSFKCEEAYKSSNDTLSFCAENGIYCCETCKQLRK